MRTARFPLCAALLWPLFSNAADPAAPASAPAPAAPAPAPREPIEPNVQHLVIQDDDIRVEELRVRGQTQSIVVNSKVGGRYEIFIGDGSRDLSDGAGSRRGVTGQRVWRVLSF